MDQSKIEALVKQCKDVIENYDRTINSQEYNSLYLAAFFAKFMELEIPLHTRIKESANAAHVSTCKTLGIPTYPNGGVEEIISANIIHNNLRLREVREIKRRVYGE